MKKPRRWALHTGITQLPYPGAHMEEILTKADNKILAAGVMGILSLPMLVVILFFIWQVYYA